MDKSKITKSLAVFASVLLIIIIGVASFAYFGTFNVNLNNNVAVNINSSSPGNATFTSNATQLNLQVPAANMSFTVANNTVAAKEDTAFLDVTLTGSSNLLTTCTYDIVYEYDAGSNVYGKSPTTKNGNKEITLQVSNVNGTNNFANEKNFDFDSSWTNNKRTLVSGASISSMGSLTTQNISITGKYYNLTISQSSLEGKSFTGKIYVTNHKCETSDGAALTILKNNGGESNITELAESEFANVTTASDKGMYKKADDLGTSYYYRGAVDNNWVKFGKEGTKDIYWRIIRINGDNSIRMIYSGTTAPTSSTSVVMTGAGSAIDRSVYNSGTNYAEYVGYMYQRGYQRNNTNNSTIKTKIDNWFAGTSLKNDSNVVDNIFCNDRSTSSSWSSRPSSNLLYNGHIRNLSYSNASLWCENKLDKFTTSSTLGNGSLTYPVGLITIDEVAMAGGYFATDNKNYYLYTGTFYYTMTPNFFRSTGTAFVFIVNNTGKFPNSSIGSTAYIRPVINLNGNVKLSGTGTYDNVYEVVK